MAPLDEPSSASSSTAAAHSRRAKSTASPRHSHRSPSRRAAASGRLPSPRQRRAPSPKASASANIAAAKAAEEAHFAPYIAPPEAEAGAGANGSNGSPAPDGSPGPAGEAALRCCGSVGLRSSGGAWTPYSAAQLPDGRICAADPASRRLLLLSAEDASGAPASASSRKTRLPKPTTVQLRRACGEGEPYLCNPYGVCAAAAEEEGDPCAAYLYVTDRYAKFPRVLRVGVDADGQEAAPRLQFWDKHSLRDPTELALSVDGGLLFVTDCAQHTVHVLCARTLTRRATLGGPSALDQPYGVAASAEELFVSEQGAHRIAVFGIAVFGAGAPSSSTTGASASYGAGGGGAGGGAGDVRRTIGSKGTEPGSLRRPRGLALVPAPRGAPTALVVAEAKRVQVFSIADGTPLQLIEPPGRAGTTLWGVRTSPWDVLLTDGGNVHVLDVLSCAERRAEAQEARAAAARAQADADAEATAEAARRAAEEAEARAEADADAREAAAKARAAKEAEARQAAEEKAAKRAERMAAAKEARAREEAMRARQKAETEAAREAREAREAAAKVRDAMEAKAERWRREQTRTFAAKQLKRQRKALAARAEVARAFLGEEAALRAWEAKAADPTASALEKETLRTDCVEATERRKAAQKAAWNAQAEVDKAEQARQAEVEWAKRRKKEQEARRKQAAEGGGESERASGGRRCEDDDEEEVDAEWAGWEEELDQEGAEETRDAEETGTAPAAGARDAAAEGGEGQEAEEEEEEEWESAAFQARWQWFGFSAAAGPPAAADDAGLEEHRTAKAAERDAAIRLILARGCRTLRAALGVAEGTASDADVKKRALKLLRLLHPDFGINHGLKGTKRHARIEAAFKKLSGLRDASEQ